MHNREISQDGFEMTFAVNHLAYFLVTSLLLDLISKSDYKRIVNVSSHIHSDNIDFDNLQFERGYSLFSAYGQSKLCNILFTYQLAEKLEGTGITVNCLHPGMVDTNLNPRRSPDIVAKAIPVEKGAVASVHLASSLSVKGISGKYFSLDGSESTSKPISYDKNVQIKLWELSESMVGEKFHFP